jgi:hypothetical protein
MEREDEGSREVETGCRGGQGTPRAVVPSGRQCVIYSVKFHLLLAVMVRGTTSIARTRDEY